MDMKVRNPFTAKDTPSDYHDYRPYYHETPFALLSKHAQGEKFKYGLDVACGTGHSSEALLKVCERITGLDASIPMIEEARLRYPGMDFREGQAETLNFPARTFDLVNISMGLHWVDHKKFISEVARVLRPKGIFSVDNYGFGGIVSADEGLQRRHFELFKEFLPSVPKNTTYPQEGLLKANSFAIVDDQNYQVILTMGQKRFISLIKTMSNFLTLSASQKENVEKEMDKVYSKIFAGKELDLKFGGRIKIYSKEF